MTEFNDNLWAPWRMQYIRSLSDALREDGCFFCRYWADPERDRENHVVWRGRRCLVVMNRFPYTNGHLMVAPADHEGVFEKLSHDVSVEMTRMLQQGVELLRRVVRAQGFNIGYNLGVCAGAGVPDHVHAHLVPRWHGDTNYMAVLGKVRVVPDALDALRDELVEQAERMGLRDEK